MSKGSHWRPYEWKANAINPVSDYQRFSAELTLRGETMTGATVVLRNTTSSVPLPDRPAQLISHSVTSVAQ